MGNYLSTQGWVRSDSVDSEPLPLASLPAACMQQVLHHLDPGSKYSLFATSHGLRQVLLSCATSVVVTPRAQGSERRVSRRLRIVARLLALPPGPACIPKLDLTLLQRHMRLLPLLSALREGRVQKLYLEATCITEADAEPLLEACEHLRGLWLRACVTAPTFFTQLAARCTRLKALTLSKVQAVPRDFHSLGTGLPALRKLSIEAVDAQLFEGQPWLLARITHLDTSDPYTQEQSCSRYRQNDKLWTALLEHNAEHMQALGDLSCLGYTAGQDDGHASSSAMPRGLLWETFTSLRGLTRLETTALLPPGAAEQPLLLGRQAVQPPPDPSELPPGLTELILFCSFSGAYLPGMGPCLAKVKEVHVARMSWASFTALPAAPELWESEDPAAAGEEAAEALMLQAAEALGAVPGLIPLAPFPSFPNTFFFAFCSLERLARVARPMAHHLCSLGLYDPDCWLRVCPASLAAAGHALGQHTHSLSLYGFDGFEGATGQGEHETGTAGAESDTGVSVAGWHALLAAFPRLQRLWLCSTSLARMQLAGLPEVCARAQRRLELHLCVEEAGQAGEVSSGAELQARIEHALAMESQGCGFLQAVVVAQHGGAPCYGLRHKLESDEEGGEVISDVVGVWQQHEDGEGEGLGAAVQQQLQQQEDEEQNDVFEDAESCSDASEVYYDLE